MINLFFVIHDHSGARTYANELLGYLSDQAEISVSKVYLDSTKYPEYKEINDEGILNIYFPRVKREAGTLEKYAARCIDIISSRLQGKENIVFHLNYGTQIKLGLEAKNRFGAKIVYTLHYLDKQFYYFDFIDALEHAKNHHLDVLEKEVIAQADKVICISQFSQRVLNKSYGISPEKTCVIYNGYGSQEMEKIVGKKKIKERLGFRKDEKLILFAGRLLVEEKGVYVLINAFKKLLQDIPNVRLVFANTGDFNEIMTQCQDVFGRVTFTGRLSMEHLRELYSIVDIGVVPSNYELLGYVPLEMMLHQLPMVISNVPGMNELIEDGVQGLKCDVYKKQGEVNNLEVDANSLCEKMKTLLTDDLIATQLAENARNLWEYNFTALRMGKETKELYKQLTESTDFKTSEIGNSCH